MHFGDYLDRGHLPASSAQWRTAGTSESRLALVDHAPNSGYWFDPISDFVVSVVLRSSSCTVNRIADSSNMVFRERQGCILLTPPEMASFWRFDGDPTVLHLAVPNSHPDVRTGKLQGAFDLPHRQTLLAARYDPVVSALAERIWDTAGRMSEGADEFLNRAVGLVVSVLLGPGGQNEEHDRIPIATLPRWRLQKAIATMRERLKVGVSNDELAAAVELSPDYFARSFRAATGMTPSRFFGELKIEEAKRLLRDPSLSLTDIALELGFASSAHFSARFRQFAGMPPSRWRAAFASNG